MVGARAAAAPRDGELKVKVRALLTAVAVAALLAVPASAQRARRNAPAAAHNWTLNVVRTAEGGVRMGNPAAPVKLIEYGSITCPHCAEFSAQGAAALRDRHVRSGRVSWEFRPYLIFPTDPGIFALLNCLPPRQFFAAAEQLYATQGAWVGRLQALPHDQYAQIQALPAAAQGEALVRAAGLDLFFRQQGLPAARIHACLNNDAALTRLAEITGQADALGVTGTPSFLINGRSVGTLNWARLEPMLAGR
jgi:protein-disulfide isomerase